MSNQQFQQNPMNQFEPEQLAVEWPWRLFFISLVIFAASVFIYLGLALGYRPFLESRILAKSSEVQKLANVVSKEEQERFVEFYSQLVNVKELLARHTLMSSALTLLEQITHRKVYFEHGSFDAASRVWELDGVADSYPVLTEQLESFRMSDMIGRVTVGQSQLSEGVVRFKASVVLKEDVF